MQRLSWLCPQYTQAGPWAPLHSEPVAGRYAQQSSYWPSHQKNIPYRISLPLFPLSSLSARAASLPEMLAAFRPFQAGVQSLPERG